MTKTFKNHSIIPRNAKNSVFSSQTYFWDIRGMASNNPKISNVATKQHKPNSKKGWGLWTQINAKQRRLENE
jgi:hypothetical protein